MKKHLAGMIFAGMSSIGLAGLADAALVGRLAATSGGTDYQAYYDDVLDITWLADANLAVSQTFGVSTVGLGAINPGGSMQFVTTNNWITAMNLDGGTGYLGFNDWRLPKVSPVTGGSFDIAFSANGSTDRGYAATTSNGSNGGWRDDNGIPVSELGYMYYVNLANLGFCDPDVPYCTAQSGSGLSNTGPFNGIKGSSYWTGSALSASEVWNFSFYQGRQDKFSTGGGSHFVWVVHSGDVAASAVPVPAAAWLFGSGLLGLCSVAMRELRRKRNLSNHYRL